MVDSGAERSTIQQIPPGCKLSKETAQVIGAKGEPFKVGIVQQVLIETKSKIGMGNFLLVPEAEFNLLGRDLMVELGIGLEVKKGELGIKLFKLTVEDGQQINPEVWYTPETVGRYGRRED